MNQDHSPAAHVLTEPVIAVGVTGHRALEKPAEIRAQVEQVLEILRKAAGEALAETRNPLCGRPLKLRIISPLAEGADRLVAETGLDGGASLQCILPLPRDEYAKDFTARGSKAAFQALLGRAERVFELDGAGARTDAYLQAGRAVVRHSDILLALWDGEPARGVGGTGDIVAEAFARGVPVVWIKPDGSPATVISGAVSRLTEHDLDILDEAARRLVQPPEAPEAAEVAADVGTFMRERRPSIVLPNFFDIAISLVLLKPRFPRLPRKGHWLDESRGYWSAPFDGYEDVRAACAPCLEDAVATPFARADALATQYAGFYRTTYLFNFLLSAVAVAIALVGVIFDYSLASVGELICIAVVMFLTWNANHSHYHERWFEYRHLAEQLRPLRLLFGLGLTLPPDSNNHDLQRAGGKGSWSSWVAHRVERELGVPNVAVTPEYLRAVRGFASHAILQEQIDYHDRNVIKLAKIEHNLHELGKWLFGLTAAGCVAHLGLRCVHLADANQKALFDAVLKLLTGLLPALGAAVLGIRNVGEFKRLEMRSQGMREALGHMQTNFNDEEPTHLSRKSLAEQIEALSAQMMSETADWRTLIITRHIELPS